MLLKNKKIFLFLIFGFLSFQQADASSLYITSNKNNIKVGETFESYVYVNSKNNSINSADAEIIFPTDKLEITSISNNPSIFNIWVEQPKFSNSTGKINFSGGVPNPGFNGNSGQILKIIFYAKNSGVANINFASADVYANDGSGSNIESGSTGTNINIQSQDIIPAPISPTPEIPKPSDTNNNSLSNFRPKISSPEISSQENWYNLSEASFNWSLTGDIKQVELGLSKNKGSTPTVVYNPPIGNKKIEDLKEGTQYLNIRYLGQNGKSLIGSYQINIDQSNPVISDLESSINSDKSINVIIDAKDEISKIRKAEAILNGKIIAESTNLEFNLPPLKEGTNLVNFKVYDQALNFAEKEFEIIGERIQKPIITKFTKNVEPGQNFEVIGNTYPNSKVEILLKGSKNKEQSFIIHSDPNGLFNFQSNNIKISGEVLVIAKVILSEFAQSEYFEAGVANFAMNKWSTFFEKNIYNLISNKYTYIAIIILLVILIYITRKPKNNIVDENIIEEIEKTKRDTRKIFNILKEDTENCRGFIKKKSKNKIDLEEKIALDEFENDLIAAEKYFESRIKSIEKKIKK